MFAGIDIGSTTTKAAIIDRNFQILGFDIIHTSFDRDKSGNEVFERVLKKAALKREDIMYIISTGYGRRALKIADETLPEIICHARGTIFLYPRTKTIIDIGGQDSKVIQLADDGRIVKFEMNDKCAAGTGRFFEVLTERLLNVSLDELGPLSLKSKAPCSTSSVCTIFAESEIISFLSAGRPKEDIAAGMHMAVAKRIISMGNAGLIPYTEPIVFSGGVAKNVGMVKTFEDLLGKKITVLEHPQSTGAIGAAIFAKDAFDKGKNPNYLKGKGG